MTHQNDERGVREVLQRSIAAWFDASPSAFSALYAANATVVLTRGIFLRGRDAIQAFMEREFSGRLKGARATDDVEDIRFIDERSAVVISLSGFLLPGESTVPAERLRRATCILTKENGGWSIYAYTNTPV